MPTTKYKIVKKGNQFCVADDSGDPIHGGKGSCHTNRDDAVKQLRAVYANKGKSFSEKCIHSQVTSFSSLLEEAKDDKIWIHAIPFGFWPHPVYGDTHVNRERAANYVKNFKENVRRQDLPIGYEHGLDKAKGDKAAGWIRDMEMREDGTWVQVEFTPTATKELSEKEWKYFSLEFNDLWLDPELDVTYEDVVEGGTLTNKPYAKDMVPINFSEAVLQEETIKFKWKEGKWIVSENGGESWRNATVDEVADLEHSEPGTGNPPEPRTDEEDKSGDKDGQGIRRDTPPPQDTKEGSKLKPETLKLLGLPEDADEAAVEEAISTAFTDLPELKEFAEKNRKKKQFAEEYPEEYARMQNHEAIILDGEAKRFSEKYSRITKTTGEGDERKTETTKRGFSGLAIQRVADMHKAFAEGKADQKMFSELMDTLSDQNAIVDYGEEGSSRTSEGEEVPTDVTSIRRKFAEKVIEVQTEEGGVEKCSWGDAIAKASHKYPDLARAYNEADLPSA